MIDQICFFLTNVAYTDKKLAKFVLSEFNIPDKILVLTDKDKKLPDYVRLNMLTILVPMAQNCTFFKKGDLARIWSFVLYNIYEGSKILAVNKQII